MEIDKKREDAIKEFCETWFGTILDTYYNTIEWFDCFNVVCMDSLTTHITIYEDNRVEILDVDNDIRNLRREEQLEEILNDL